MTNKKNESNSINGPKEKSQEQLLSWEVLSSEIKAKSDDVLKNKEVILESLFSNKKVALEHISMLITRLVNTLGTFDQSTGKHVLSVGELMYEEIDSLLKRTDIDRSEFLDEKLISKDDNYIKYVYFLAALLHDQGKVGIMTSTLNKPSKLDTEDMDHMEEHAIFSKIITDFKKEGMSEENATVSYFVSMAAGQHHRKLNGGYPSEEYAGILLKISMLLAIVDIFEGVSSKRIYTEETEPRELFKKGVIVLISHKEGLNKKLLAIFLSKFGIDNIDNLTEDNIDSELEKLDRNNKNIIKQIHRIESSIITSEKTFIEANQSQFLGEFGGVETQSEYLKIFNELGITKKVLELMKDLNISGKNLLKLAQFEKVADGEKFGDALEGIVSDWSELTEEIEILEQEKSELREENNQLNEKIKHLQDVIKNMKNNK